MKAKINSNEGTDDHTASIIGNHFNRKQYGRVVELVSKTSVLRAAIVNETQAEIVALAAFSFFNLKDYNATVRQALKLISHLESNQQVESARDLYENLVIITFDSLIALRQNLRAYFFLKRKIVNILNEKQSARVRLDKTKTQTANLIWKLINYSVPAFGFVIVVLQTIFKFLDPTSYMAILISVIVLLLFIWNSYDFLVQKIKNFL